MPTWAEKRKVAEAENRAKIAREMGTDGFTDPKSESAQAVEWRRPPGSEREWRKQNEAYQASIKRDIDRAMKVGEFAGLPPEVQLPCDVEPAEELHIIVELEETPKGVCPKCNKHIGRGVHFHAKKCRGN